MVDPKKIYKSQKSPYRYEKMDSLAGGELAYAQMLDEDADVLAWTKNHSIAIKYRNKRGGISRYLPDFLVRYKNTDVPTLIEVKGEHLMHDPDWKSKEKAAHDWCKVRGMEFRVIISSGLRKAA